MRSTFCHGGARLVLLAIAILALPSLAMAEDKLTAGIDGFKDSAKVLRAAADAVEGQDEHDSVMLLQEVYYEVQGHQVIEHGWRELIKIHNDKGVERWSSLSRGWAPWYQERPELRVRVLDPSNKFHELDPSSIEEVQPPKGEDHTYSDWRELRAPLPALRPGSVIELRSTVKGRHPYSKAGNVQQWYLGAGIPVLATRIVVESDRALSTKVHLAPTLRKKHERRGKTHVYRFETGPLEAVEYESNQPYDTPVTGMVSFSTAKSWKELAEEYAAIVDKSIGGGSKALPVPQNAGSRDERIAAALALLHDKVRYTGLEFGENAIVPWTPTKTLERQYGDCKDKATLLTAMLRRMDIEAHVALVRSGYGYDVDPALPGMGRFNHAIVYVPGNKKDQAHWIDATADLAKLGQTPYAIQGRRALVARKGENKLRLIPVPKAQNNAMIEERRITVHGYEDGEVSETTHYLGSQEMGARSYYASRDSKEIRKGLDSYAANHYHLPKLGEVRIGRPEDLSKDFELTIGGKGAGVIKGGTRIATVDINRRPLFDLLSNTLLAVANEASRARHQIPARKKSFRVTPSHKQWNYEIHFPKGFAVKTLPRDQDRMLGAVRFRQAFKVHEGYLQATFSVTIEKRVLSPKEVATTRQALADFYDSAYLSLNFHHHAMGLWDWNKKNEALALQQRTLEGTLSKEERALNQAILAESLMNLGLNGVAIDVAREAVEHDPHSLLASETLAYVKQRSPFGGVYATGHRGRESIPHLRKALELVPADTRLESNLLDAMLRDEEGVFMAGDLEQARPIAERLAKLEPRDKGLLYLRLLLHLEDYDAILEWTDNHERSKHADAARIAALFASKQEKRAITEAHSPEGQEALGTAVWLLAARGDYARAATLIEKGYTGEDSWFYDTIRTMAGHTRVKRPKTSRQLVQLVARRLLDDEPVEQSWLYRPDPELGDSSFASFLRRQLDSIPGGYHRLHEVDVDLLVANLDVKELASYGSWKKLELSTPFDKSTAEILVRQLKGRVRLLGDVASYNLAAAALESVDEGRHSEVAAFAELIDSTTKVPEDDGPISFYLAADVWKASRGHKEADRVAWYAAAQLRFFHSLPSQAKRLQECASHDIPACQLALAVDLGWHGEKERALEALAKVKDEQLRGVWSRHVLKAEILMRGKDHEGVVTHARSLLADDSLHEMDRSFAKLHLAYSLVVLGKFDEALEIARTLHDDKGTPYKLRNHIAWAAVLHDPDPKKVASLAFFRGKQMDYLYDDSWASAHGMRLVGPTAALGHAEQHTLATLLAAAGDNAGAMEALTEAQRKRRGKIEPGDWLVYGRVAANLGYADHARRAYERVLADREQQEARVTGAVPTSADIAERWLAELKGAK